jgi:hypothetical protein
MDMKVKMKAKEHVKALEMLAEDSGVSVQDLVEQVLGAEEAQESEGMDEGMEEGEGEDEAEMGPRKDKIALIVARMKKAKEE